MSRPLCIYHGNCADGFGAAWAVRHALGGRVDFHHGVHQNPPPDVTDRDVIIVDFSYKRPVLMEMAKTARSILILDHHKSAAEDLIGLGHDLSRSDFDPSYAEWTEGAIPQLRNAGTFPLGVLFDMERSGAGITWDFFHDAPRPPLIDHLEDRDLWRFALPGTREIQATVFSYPYDFAVWDDLMRAPLEELRLEGRGIERKHHKDVAELVAALRQKAVIAGHVVPVASLPYTLTSDAGHLMCQPVDEGLGGVWVPPFAACYWDTPDGRVYSLRSDDKAGGADCSAVAKLFGGGGHKNAAGFRVAHGQSVEEAPK